MIVSRSINHKIQYLPRNSVYQEIQNLEMTDNGFIYSAENLAINNHYC